MNQLTSTRYCPADLLEKLDADIHPWLLSEREGGNKSTLSYVKVDILTDTLNRLFGPLGWGVEAEIQKMDDFQYEKPGYQNYPPTEMYVFQVISQVKLTIKPQTEGGSPTVFIQSGVGYGEVKINGHRKDAVGMAVKGAESDGLKRCCNFLGRALGMFLVGGKQDPVVYAHNGNKNRAVISRAMRDREDYERRNRSSGRGGNEDEAQDRQDRGDHEEHDRRDDRNSRSDREQFRGQDEGGTRSAPENEDRNSQKRQERSDPPRSRERAARDSHEEQDRNGQGSSEGQRQRASKQDEDTAGKDERQDRGKSESNAADQRTADNADEGEKTTGRRRSNARSNNDAEKKDDAGKAREEGNAGGKRRASTTYDLRRVPVTRENQKDFGATFVRHMEGMRQVEEQDQMLKNYAQRINELDPDIRALIVERLHQRNINVSILD